MSLQNIRKFTPSEISCIYIIIIILIIAKIPVTTIEETR